MSKQPLGLDSGNLDKSRVERMEALLQQVHEDEVKSGENRGALMVFSEVVRMRNGLLQQVDQHLAEIKSDLQRTIEEKFTVLKDIEECAAGYAKSGKDDYVLSAQVQDLSVMTFHQRKLLEDKIKAVNVAETDIGKHSEGLREVYKKGYEFTAEVSSHLTWIHERSDLSLVAKHKVRGNINYVAITKDSLIALAYYPEPRVDIFDFSFKEVQSIKCEGHKVCGMAATKEGSIAVFLTQNDVDAHGFIKVFNPATGIPVSSINIAKSWTPSDIAVNNDGKFLILCVDRGNGTIILVDSDGEKLSPYEIELKDALRMVCGGKYVFVVSEHCNVGIFVMPEVGVVKPIKTINMDFLLYDICAILDRDDVFFCAGLRDGKNYLVRYKSIAAHENNWIKVNEKCYELKDPSERLGTSTGHDITLTSGVNARLFHDKEDMNDISIIMASMGSDISEKTMPLQGGPEKDSL